VNIITRLTKREKIILYSVVAVVAVSLIYSFAIEPLYRRWVRSNQDLSLAKIRLHKSLSVIANKEKTDAEYALYSERLMTAGSDEQEMTAILNTLEVIARSAGLKIINIKPKPAQDKQFYSRFIVDLETESDMRGLMKFIYDTRNSPLMLKVDRLSLNTKSSRDGLVIRASLTISKFSLK